MSAVDFLFEGKSPTPGTTSTTSQVQLPEWYTKYTTDMLSRAQAVANLPYAQYTGPRIAGFTPAEQAGFAATQQAANAYQPFLQQAQTALGTAGATTGLGAATGDLTKAGGMMGAVAAQPFFGQAAGMLGMTAAAPLFQQALPAIQQAGRASAVTAAQPFLNVAARTFPQAAEEYMNPYTKAVVEQLGDVGVRQLQEKYLPAIGQEFIQAGQFGPGRGSSRMGEFGARALRDVQQSILGEQSKALQAGYGQAADIFGQDVARAAQLAGTVGQLSTSDYARLLESGARVADVGAKIGQLTSEDANRLAEIGKATGTLTAQDAQLLARIGETKGQLAVQDSANLQSLAQKYLSAAEGAQTMGLRGAEAITDVGTKERAMQQANLDLAYKDFLAQQQYPAEQVKFLSDILSGVQLPQTTVQQTTTTPAQQGGASAIQKAIAAGAGINELIDLVKKYFPSGVGGSKSSTGEIDWMEELRKLGIIK